MRRALIIADLEGVAGVDALAGLISGERAYESARRRMTEEVICVARALLAKGLDAVRVSDSHICGSGEANILRSELPPEVELVFLDDAYAPEVFHGVEGVIALGMHAAAGTSGFAAHTVDLHTEWRVDGRPISETEIVARLAAEHGAPLWFVSGDDGLRDSLPFEVGYVCTKQFQDGVAKSHALTDVISRLESAVYASAGETPPKLAELERPGEIDLVFKGAVLADLAQAAGGQRIGPLTVRVCGDGFRDAYTQAWALSEAAAEPVSSAFRADPGTSIFLEDLQRALDRPARWSPPEVEPWELERARAGFEKWTASGTEEARALRALTWSMLEHHAPTYFAQADGPHMLGLALDALDAVSTELRPDLDPDVLQARVDAWYLRHRRDPSIPELDQAQVRATLDGLVRDELGIYAWVLASMLRARGVQVPVDQTWADARGERIIELYRDTHVVLFESDYLLRPVSAEQRQRFGGLTQRLAWALPWAIERAHVDLIAEIAIVLQATGEEGAPEHALALDAVRGAMSEDGTVKEASMGVPWEEMADHATAVALIALAGARERASPGLDDL